MPPVFSVIFLGGLMENYLLPGGLSAGKSGAGATRREFLLAALAAAFAAAAPRGALAAETAGLTAALEQFIHISQTITESDDLDPQLAGRFFVAFAQGDAQFAPRLAQLVPLATPGLSAQDFMAKAESAGLRDFLYQIITSWYTGTIGGDYRGILVAYQQALMYRTVRDGLTVPTYCGNGPIWWTAPVPDESRAGPGLL